jgi:3-deoxy-D-manno-octulosonic-acid transferase
VSLTEAAYRAGLRVARPLLHAARPLHGGLRRALDGRARARGVLARFGAQHDDGDVVWVHAPSVGEALMAQAIIGALRSRRAGVRVLFTHFSPSAERVADRVGADAAAYLPFDLPADVRASLDAVRPDAIVFVRTEVWPTLTAEAARRGVRVGLVNAVLGPGSSRLAWPARALLRPGYARLDVVGAVAEADAVRFYRLGVAPGRVRVTGDARFDQVAARVAALDMDTPVLQRLRDATRFTLVAGSTWPADEARLVPALARLARGRPVRAVVAPHQPDAAHLAGLERRLDAAGLAHARLGAVEAGTSGVPPVVVVDRVGVLAELYAVGDAAYVGGGFGRSGLHSVVEPAALGRPVLFGPRHGNAREAAELEAERGGAMIRGPDELAARLVQLAADPDARDAAGRAARAFVEARLGGAARNADVVAGLLDRPPAR